MEELHKKMLKRSTILLVDDNQQIMEKLKRLLSIYVCEIYEAENGQDGYDMYQQYNPSIIFTDIEMPISNGLDLVTKIREDNSDIPIVIMSAYTNESYLLKSIKLKLSEYLIKPIKHEDILKILEDSAKQLLKNTLAKQVSLNYDYIYDPQNELIKVYDKKIALTNKENLFIELLILYRGNLVTKKMCEDKMYGAFDMPASTLKNLVFRLRKKVDKLVVTVGKSGYMIE